MLLINSAFEIRLENASVKFYLFHIIFQFIEYFCNKIIKVTIFHSKFPMKFSK